MVSIFTATANAAITTGPKLFTTACTISIPRFMTDCCRHVSPESDRMLRKCLPFHFMSLRRGRYSGQAARKKISMPIPEAYCAITVAAAAPAIPQPSGMTNSRSSPTFSTTDTPRKISGAMEFPMLLSRLET